MNESNRKNAIAPRLTARKRGEFSLGDFFQKCGANYICVYTNLVRVGGLRKFLNKLGYLGFLQEVNSATPKIFDNESGNIFNQ